jgi:hypothetical protein
MPTGIDRSVAAAPNGTCALVAPKRNGASHKEHPLHQLSDTALHGDTAAGNKRGPGSFSAVQHNKCAASQHASWGSGTIDFSQFR